MTVEELADRAADLHADQQAMPDPGALAAHRELIHDAYQLGQRHVIEDHEPLVEIARELAERGGPVTCEDSMGGDYCALCSAPLPYGKIGERQVGVKCASCGNAGHYDPLDLSRCCGVSFVPNMVDVRGVVEDPALHDSNCAWRLAVEWAAANPERTTT